MVIITVHYHAILREKLCRSSEIFSLEPSQLNGEVLFNLVAAKYPAFQSLRASLQVAVNNEIVKGPVALKNGDTIDFLPPFGGG